ncbi:DUF3098 domain-containing protein [Chitinophaga sp. CB10]|uniref:DUF3098 domain-containing protein n=1 Tax=Chitinophaga sp. CB10 TaxID=1891659 RepID=UPI0025BAA48E|nr:DUF3098 domain-containing protein [Chitinophaga sp. CB10]
MVKPTQNEDQLVEDRSIFPKENYRYMQIGIAVVIIGFLLMKGGKSPDANTFNIDDVYSFRRITLAPIVIVLGLLIEVYAIMRRPKK